MDFAELEQGACSHLCKHMPTKLCVMVEAGLDHSGVHAAEFYLSLRKLQRFSHGSHALSSSLLALTK